MDGRRKFQMPLGSQRNMPYADHNHGMKRPYRILSVHDLTLQRLNSAERYRDTFRAERSSMGDAPGVDGINLSDFTLPEMSRCLSTVADAISEDVFVPQDLRCVEIPKLNGKPRLLLLPVAAERVVAKAICNVLMDLFDRGLPDALHGNRRGRSIHTLLSATAESMKSGNFLFVGSADIRDAFPSTRREFVSQALERFVPCSRVRRLLLRLSYPEETRTGLPQGLATSPILFNLLMSDGLPWSNLGRQDELKTFVYVDNFVFVGKSEEMIEDAYQTAVKGLERIGLGFKEPLQITKLTKGRKAKLFGHNLSRRNGSIFLDVGWEAYRRLEIELGDSILDPNPRKRAMEIVTGWREYFAKPIESSGDKINERIQAILERVKLD